MSLRKCLACGTYSLSEQCPKCGGEAVSPAPARFSLERAKKYGKYRRELLKRYQEQQTKEEAQSKEEEQ